MRLAFEILGALALAIWIWGLAVHRHYRLRGLRPKLLRVRCADGWELGVHFRPAAVRRFREPIVLAHGLAVTHQNLDFEPPYSLAHALCEAGFDCFSVDWRGNGASAKAPRGQAAHRYCADDHIALDAPAVLSLALATSGAERAFWIGHSLGGVVGYAVASGQEGARLAGVVALGSPAFFVRPTARLRRGLGLALALAWPWRIHQRLAALLTAPLVGWFHLPLSASLINPAHVEPRIQRKLFATLIASVSRRMLLQFRSSISRERFQSLDGRIDYAGALGSVRVPALVAAGAVDRMVTPASVEAAHAALGSRDKTLVVFGRARGDGMDYGHGDLIFGRGAPKEVYPLIRDWLVARATAHCSSLGT